MNDVKLFYCQVYYSKIQYICKSFKNLSNFWIKSFESCFVEQCTNTKYCL